MGDYQVGVLPVTNENEPKVALVTTRSGSRWTFPKGHTEEGRCDREVAEEEAYEEAGLIGEVQSLYQEFGINFGSSDKLRLYRMNIREILDQWPESGERQRVLVSIQQAEKLLGADLRTCLRHMLT